MNETETREREGGTRRAVLALLLLVAILAGLLLWSRSPAEPYDYIRAKAAALDFEVERLHGFVRDEVETHAYDGLLRGPVGTLWAGAGNAPDRAGLLAALLRAADREARLARAGERWWVQTRGSEKEAWTDLFLDDGAATSAEWTGAEPPAELVRELRIAVRVESAGGPADGLQKAVYRVADLVHHPLALTFRPDGGYRLAPLGGDGPVVEGSCSGSKDETLTVHFEEGLSRQSAATTRYRREIFTGRHPGYRKLNDPRDVHIFAVAPGRILDWAQAKERELTRAKVEASGTDVAACYLLALSHLAASDRALPKLAKDFGVKAHYAEPRVIVASSYNREGHEGPGALALDLRHNVIRSTGEEQARASFGLARAALEGQLEGEVLRQATGRYVVAALDVFAEHLRTQTAGSQQRLALYKDLLERLLDEARPGAKLVLAIDERTRVVLARGEGPALTVDSISPELKTKLDAAPLPWDLLKAGAVPRDRVAQAAVELETLLGPVAGAALDYLPQVDFQESTTNLLGTDVRIFTWRKTQDKMRMTFEYQFLKVDPDGDLVYECVDYWDEVDRRPYRAIRRLTIPKKTLDSSDVVSHWYEQGRYNQGDCFLTFSRKMHRELKEQGFTIVRFRDRSNKLGEPLKLYLCKTGEIELPVNNRPRKLPVLYVAGGYAKDNLPKQAYADVPIIKDATNPGVSATNRWVVLDDPLFPLQGLEGSRIQTAIPGKVISTLTGLGVPGAKVTIERAQSSGTTWADGTFRLPLIKQPLGVFRVVVEARGYAPFAERLDLAAEDAFPLKLSLEPRPEPDELLWIGAADLAPDGKLATLENPRIRDLVRAALEDDPLKVAWVPRKRVAHGPASAHAWLVFRPGHFHFDAVTEDGLHGTVGDFWMWMHEDLVGILGKEYLTPRPTEPHQQAVSAMAGFIASWYAYSAGKLDALTRMLDGEDFSDIGHQHAMNFALKFLAGMEQRLDNWPAGYFGASSAAYRAGFLAGLEYFEREPIFRGK